MRKLMEALISEGLVQVALDVQDVFEAPTGPAFSIEELGVRWGRGGFVVTNNETLRLTDNPDGHRDCGEHHIIHMSNGGEPR